MSFSYSYNNDPRVGKKFIEYINDEQFEKDVREYVELANDYILKYRAFSNINYAKQYIIDELNDNNWNPYIKAMFYFLTDDIDNGRKYYKVFLDEPFFKRIIDEKNYPQNINEMNKDYVMNMISKQSKFWRNKSSMKKMKINNEYER